MAAIVDVTCKLKDYSVVLDAIKAFNDLYPLARVTVGNVAHNVRQKTSQFLINFSDSLPPAQVVSLVESMSRFRVD